MNEQERVSYLLNQYANNSCSIEEFDELLKLINNGRHNLETTNALKEIWENTSTVSSKSEMEWESLYTSMMAATLKNNKTTYPLWQKIAVAAMFFIIATTALIFYKNKTFSPAVVVNKVKSVQELAPGGNKAVLTLANGEKIILDGRDNGRIANQTGIAIIKSNDGQLIYKLSEGKMPISAGSAYNVITVPKGGQYQVMMSDGTRVWLNSMSSLKYPIHFTSNERKVELTGEGYFEVAKNPNAPFRVKTDNQVIEVIGTHFNVNAYQNETATRTTLVEGAVRIVSGPANKKTLLAPGQQSVLTTSGITVKEVDTETSIAWKNGNFVFDKDNLERVMRQISRWYDVEVIYKNEAVKERLLSGGISRFENASQVLEILELTGLVHFKIEGRRIIVM